MFSMELNSNLEKSGRIPKKAPKMLVVNQVQQSIDSMRDAVANVLEPNKLDESVLQARLAHQKSLLEKGEILSPDHFIYQQLAEIVNKINVPAGTELVVLDSEDFLAYYNLQARQITISRGVMMHLNKHLPNFSKDHLAALLSHETEHAVAHQSPSNTRDYGSKAGQLMTTFDPAEEMRADSEGMKRAAKAGYNPRAMIDILRTFGLTGEREGLMHPEVIDRIRYLELRLVSDEHPLANTTNKYQSLQPQFKAWSAESSLVYEEIEGYLADDWQGLDKRQQEAKNWTEFFNIYWYRTAIKNLAKGKQLAENPLTAKLLGLAVIYDQLQSVRGKYDPNFSTAVSRVITTDHYKALAKAEEMRERLLPVQIDVADWEYEVKKEIAKLEEWIENEVEVKDEEIATLSQENKDLLLDFKTNWTNSDFRDKLLAKAFTSMDRAVLRQERLESNTAARASGRRARFENAADLEAGIDTTDPNVLAKLKSLYSPKLAGIFLSSDKAEQWEKDQLKDLLLAQSFLPEEAGFFSEILLTGADQEKITAFAKGMSKERIAMVIQFFHTHQKYLSLRFSPMRSAHGSLLAACEQLPTSQKFSLYFSYTHHFPDGGADGMGSGLNGLIRTLAWNYYTRAYPEGYLDDMKVKYKSPDQLDFNEKDWEVLRNSELPSMAEESLKLAIKKLHASGGDGQKLSAYWLKILMETNSMPWNKTNMEVKEYSSLLDYRLWDDSKTQLLMKNIVEEYLREAAGKDIKNPEDKVWLEDVIELARKLRQVAVRAPYQFEAKNRYDRSPVVSATELSANIMNLSVKLDSKQFGDLLLSELNDNQDVAMEMWSPDLRKALYLLGRERWEELSLSPGLQLPQNQSLRIVLNILLIGTQVEGQNSNHLANVSAHFGTPEAYGDFTQWLKDLVAGTPVNSVEKIIELVKKMIPESPWKDRYLMMAADIWPDSDLKAEHYQKIRDQINWKVDLNGRQNAHPDPQYLMMETNDHLYQFNAEQFLKDRADEVKKRMGKDLQALSPDEVQKVLVDLFRDSLPDEAKIRWGQGLQRENFDDLIWRRHNFIEEGRDFTSRPIHRWNNFPRNEAVQHYLAEQLRNNEELILASELLSTRLIELLKIAPEMTVVRDIYLEKMMRDALEKAVTAADRLEVAQLLWPLLTDQCISKSFLALQYLQSKFELEPQLLKEADAAIAIINHYLPRASFAKNALLERVEMAADLRQDQLKKILALRMSDEGKEDNSENGFGALVLNKINEMNRSERAAFYLWLIGLTPVKPQTIFNLEMRTVGNADGFKKIFATMDKAEQAKLIERLSLGKEGLLDLEAVDSLEKIQSQTEKGVFIDTLLNKVFSLKGEGIELLRKIMRVILIEADPAKSSKILAGLTHQLLEAEKVGKKINMPQLASLMLSEMGVVGKKLAQSLAELDFLPADFRKEFKKVQSEAQHVPKRALAELADSYGLLEGRDGVRIISFGKMLGAASNKQACLLEVEITRSGLPLPPGRHQLVGKFKRPSAQKSANLDSDLQLLEKAMMVLGESKQKSKLPAGFLDTLRDAVLRELDFNKEADFAKLLRRDIRKLDEYQREYQLNLPEIVYANNDLVLETLAPGISLREYLDAEDAGQLEAGYVQLDRIKIMQKVLTEAMRELLVSGNVHADLHPGNIFVSKDKKVTLIDVGMNEVLDENQRAKIISLLTGLLSGSDILVKRALKGLGLVIEGKFALKVGDFNENVNRMIEVSRQSKQKIPSLITSIFSSVSKLATYAKDLDRKAMVATLKEVGGHYWKRKIGLDGIDLDQIF